MVIEVNKLQRFYKDGEMTVKALNEVSFKIKMGEFVAIMGPSGCGKTTMLRILALLDNQTGGKYSIQGLEVSTLPEAEKSYYRLTEIGYVFQDYALINEMSIIENVAILSLMDGNSMENAVEVAKKALEKVGLTDKGDKIPDQLSGGEKQRVAIARAIAKKPSILFADEPCANLDKDNSLQVLKVFEELNKKYGQTVIMVTHEPWHVKYVSRVIKIEDGILVKDSKPNKKMWE